MSGWKGVPSVQSTPNGKWWINQETHSTIDLDVAPGIYDCHVFRLKSVMSGASDNR